VRSHFMHLDLFHLDIYRRPTWMDSTVGSLPPQFIRVSFDFLVHFAVNKFLLACSRMQSSTLCIRYENATVKSH